MCDLLVTKPGQHHPTQSSFHTQARGGTLCFPTWSQLKFRGKALPGWASCPTLVGMMRPAEWRVVARVPFPEHAWERRGRLSVRALHAEPALRRPRAAPPWERTLLGVWTYRGDLPRGPLPHSPQSRCLIATLFLPFYPSSCPLRVSAPRLVTCTCLALRVELRSELGVTAG